MDKNNYLSKRGYVVRKDLLTKEELKEIKNELIARPLVDEKFSYFKNNDTSFTLYTETQNKIYVPKMYGLRRFGVPKELDNYIGKSWSDGITFKGKLRSEQVEPGGVLIETLNSELSGGILSLNTGFGKTFLCLYVLSKLKKKALIIVNKISLMKQWEQEIKTFLPEADIGFLQGQKNVDVQDKDIVIAMLQSLAKIDYPQDLLDDIGVTVFDEIHNTSTQVFSKVLMKTSSKYTIGLSATPKRSDGCEYVFKWYIGDIVYTTTSVRKGLSPVVQNVKVSSSEYKEVATTNKMTGQKQIMFTSMLSELIGMEKRNKLIVEMIKYYITENRKILVLTDRRDHAKQLKLLLDKDKGVTFTSGLFMGQMKIEELQRSRDCQVILATFSSFGEGVSEKDLNTLFLTSPKKFIGHLKNTVKNESGKLEQYIGRIFRKEHTDIQPLIVDIHDNFSVYKNQSRQRMAFYKEHFKTVQFIDSTINLDEFETDNISFSSLKTKTAKSEEPTNSNLYEKCLLE